MSEQDNITPTESLKPSNPGDLASPSPQTSRVTTKTSQVPLKTSRVSLSGKPETKTSQIPLRKETVRITLKATPDPKDGPAAPKAMSAPTAPLSGGMTAPKAPLPPSTSTIKPTPPTAPAAPTIPLRAGAPGAAPTVPLKKPGVPSPAGAPTIPLRPGAPGTPSATTPLRPAPGGAAGSTQVLPQATTKLRQTQPLGVLPPPSVPTSVAPKTSSVSDHAEESDTINIILAALILLTAIFLGLLQYAKSNVAEVPDSSINKVAENTSWTELLTK